MKYEKPIIITYSEEEVLAIIGPAQTGGSTGLDDAIIDQELG